MVSARSVCAVAISLLSTAQVLAEPVRWSNGPRAEPAPMARAELRATLAALASRAGASHVVVHFAGPLDRARRAAIESSGVHLLDYLGADAYFAALADGADPGAASAVAGLVAIEPVDPRHKLHPDLAAGILHPWSVVPAAGSVPTVAIYVLFHRDVAVDAVAPALLARHGGSVRSFVRAVGGAVAHLPLDRVADLAGEDAVKYVEPPLPALVAINAENRARVQADVVQGPPFDLDGADIDVLVYDAGRVFAHDDLAGRLTIGASDSSAGSDHATHVACTVAGDGAESAGAFRGMAPASRVVSYGFEQEGGISMGFLYTDPGDIEADYGEAIAQYGADLANNSIGTNTASNGFPCEWEGNYGVTGALIDEIARGALGEPFRIVWANGNERSTGACGLDYHTTAPPACAKNHITVGALNSNTDGVASFSSWGPCDDGRIKPDVSAPGCATTGDFGVTSCSAGGGYGVKCGTSMASPTVAGVVALLLEQFRRSFPGAPDPQNATVKAILAQTAVDVGASSGPDYQTGYGSVRALPAVESIAAERWFEGEVADGETLTLWIAIAPGDGELRVTLAWDDPAGMPGVDPVLVNDLDLRVVGPAGTVHHPFTLDPANPALPAVRTVRDSVNNIEQVLVDDPAPGYYRVEIEGVRVADGPLQSFGLAAAPNLFTCRDAAALEVDRARATCDALLGISLNDCGLDLDEATVESVALVVTSDSEAAGETVVLTETAPFSAHFTGSLRLGTADAAGVLQVADGETVRVTYVDADDGAGGTGVAVTREVAVDCRAPVITGVTAHDVGRRGATIAISADEPVLATVLYGTSCNMTVETAAGGEPGASHEVEIAGLQDGVTYFYKAVVRDEAGNVTEDDGGGACHSFTTLAIPEFYTENFTWAFDLEGLTITFTPDGSPDFYAACAQPLVGGLPTNPAGGTDLDLGDDVARPFTIAGGEGVRLYGVEHDTVWVGPNGFVTFGAGDNTFEEDLAIHFGLPRIAALFDDLNPGASGAAVVWNELADRVAVSWVDVPEYQNDDRNTFQIEMFFDGRIRLSWLEVDGPDGIVGLSDGGGLDPDFAEWDMSASAGCGPFPPLVRDVAAATNVGDEVSIALLASDDGLPAPGALTFRVASMPAFGTLVDPLAGEVVEAAPHDLAGDTVVYRPYPGFGGADAFSFAADDGGLPPQGGSSQPAVAAIVVTVGAPEIVRDLFPDDEDPGFSATGAWAFGEPAGGGSHGGDPTAGATGRKIYGYNLAGDYANLMGPEFLTTPAIDLRNVAGTVLEFERWLGVEAASHDHAAIEASTDGVTWTTVWNHFGPAIGDSAWTARAYDVSAIADGRAQVFFRWRMGPTDAAVTYPGWNVDDVRLRGTVQATCSAAPGEAQALGFAGDRRTLTWSYSSGIGQPPPVYDTIRSPLPADFSAAVALCVEADGTDRAATDPDVPPPGTAFHYLVRVEGDCGPGPLGGERSARSCEP